MPIFTKKVFFLPVASQELYANGLKKFHSGAKKKIFFSAKDIFRQSNVENRGRNSHPKVNNLQLHPCSPETSDFENRHTISL
jgi:hypothetical protein